MCSLHAVCWLARSALRDVLAEVRRYRLRETGGALLGWREGAQYVVTTALGPGPQAKHGLTYFEPDATWQSARGREIYFASARTVAYLGDWHTHPWSGPVPSYRDHRTAQDIAEDPAFRAPQPLYGIVGYSARRREERDRKPTIYVCQDGHLSTAAVVLFEP
jgi:integrative and conjugative element protein (TIGR02256 family)